MPTAQPLAGSQSGPGAHDSRAAAPGAEPQSRRRPEPAGLEGQLGLLAVLLAPAPRVQRCQLPETWPPAPQVGEVLL